MDVFEADEEFPQTDEVGNLDLDATLDETQANTEQDIDAEMEDEAEEMENLETESKEDADSPRASEQPSKKISSANRKKKRSSSEDSSIADPSIDPLLKTHGPLSNINKEINVGAEFQAIIEDFDDPDYMEREEPELVLWEAPDNVDENEIFKFANDTSERFLIPRDIVLYILAKHKMNFNDAFAEISQRNITREPWKEDEKLVFENTFVHTGKNFQQICLALKNRSLQSVIKHYYGLKKQVNYKQFANSKQNTSFCTEEQESQPSYPEAFFDMMCENCGERAENMEVMQFNNAMNRTECRACQIYYKTMGVPRPTSLRLILSERIKNQVSCPEVWREYMKDYERLIGPATGKTFVDRKMGVDQTVEDIVGASVNMRDFRIRIDYLASGRKFRAEGFPHDLLTIGRSEESSTNCLDTSNESLTESPNKTFDILDETLNSTESIQNADETLDSSVKTEDIETLAEISIESSKDLNKCLEESVELSEVVKEEEEEEPPLDETHVLEESIDVVSEKPAEILMETENLPIEPSVVSSDLLKELPKEEVVCKVSEMLKLSEEVKPETLEETEKVTEDIIEKTPAVVSRVLENPVAKIEEVVMPPVEVVLDTTVVNNEARETTDDCETAGTLVTHVSASAFPDDKTKALTNKPEADEIKLAGETIHSPTLCNDTQEMSQLEDKLTSSEVPIESPQAPNIRVDIPNDILIEEPTQESLNIKPEYPETSSKLICGSPDSNVHIWQAAETVCTEEIEVLADDARRKMFVACQHASRVCPKKVATWKSDMDSLRARLERTNYDLDLNPSFLFSTERIHYCEEWTDHEKETVIRCFDWYGDKFDQIADLLGTKTAVQIYHFYLDNQKSVDDNHSDYTKRMQIMMTKISEKWKNAL